jgi:hypothetical protein
MAGLATRCLTARPTPRFKALAANRTRPSEVRARDSALELRGRSRRRGIEPRSKALETSLLPEPGVNPETKKAGFRPREPGLSRLNIEGD